MLYNTQKHICIVAGEASGDQYGAQLVQVIKSRTNDIHFSGIGGHAMQSAGVHITTNLAQYGAFGGSELLKHLGVIFRAYRQIKQHLRAHPPNLLILIDYPGFNLRLAKFAKKLGIKILYYISPQLWAWKPRRINVIRDTVALMAVILPFEVPIYRHAGVPVRYVGHPLTDYVRPTMSKSEARTFFQLGQTHKVIGLLPGSRISEIKRLLPIMVAVAERLNQQDPHCQFILPVASSLTIQEVQTHLPRTQAPIKLVQGHAYDVMQCSDALVITSGTATLEAALIGTPMVIIYKLSAISFAIAKRLIKVDYIGLCNLLAKKSIVPELIQHQASPENIATEINKYLSDAQHRQTVNQQLLAVRDILKLHNAEIALNQLVLDMLSDD